MSIILSMCGVLVRGGRLVFAEMEEEQEEEMPLTPQNGEEYDIVLSQMICLLYVSSSPSLFSHSLPYPPYRSLRDRSSSTSSQRIGQFEVC